MHCCRSLSTGASKLLYYTGNQPYARAFIHTWGGGGGGEEKLKAQMACSFDH